MARLGIQRVSKMTIDACKVLMIFPRFNTDSFWNYRATCELTREGANFFKAVLDGANLAGGFLTGA
jgi:uncharacterized protein YjbI with pentapeptide repeats